MVVPREMEPDSSSDENRFERQQQQKIAESSKESKSSSSKKNREESSSSSMSEGEDVVKRAVVDKVAVVPDVAPVVDVAKVGKVDSKSRSHRKDDAAEENVETSTDPGLKFQISSYHSFVPVVRKSPNILEKIKLFSPTSDEIPDLTIKNNFVSSFNPLLPKESSASNNLVDSRYKTLPLRNKTNLISSPIGDLNAKTICPPSISDSYAKKSFEREIISGLKKDVESKCQTKAENKNESDCKTSGKTDENCEQPIVSVANLAKHFSDENRMIEKQMMKGKKKPEKIICSILPDNENEDEFPIKLSEIKTLEDKIEAKPELSEDVKQEIKAFAKSLNERNRGFVDQCIAKDKKMLKDCSMGESLYREWNLQSEKSNFGQIKREEIFSNKPHIMISSPKRNSLFRRNSQPLNDGLEINSSQSRTSKIPRAKSVETEMGKWDCFLKEIGRLSIEIDDENETFI